jgi:hypothetical protein
LQASTATEKEELDKKYKSFNVEYKKKDALIREQKKLIDERNKFIKSLEERIKTLEKKYELETSSSQDLIKQLRAQLEAQSSQIAQLTLKLHNVNKAAISNTIRNNSISLNYSETSGFNPEDTKPKKTKNKTPKELRNSLSSSSALVLNKNMNNTINRSSSSLSIESLNSNFNSNLNIEETNLVSASNSNFLDEITRLNTNSNNQTVMNSTSRSNSARSDRSMSTPGLTKQQLPPAVARKSDLIPPPDPKPFLLQSSQSTLHSRAKRDNLIHRRTIISLPPIKPFEVVGSQLAVECPHNLFLNGPGATTNSNKNKNMSN